MSKLKTKINIQQSNNKEITKHQNIGLFLRLFPFAELCLEICLEFVI
jgi:hypothetical protein